jgi:predicted permease
MREWLTRLLDWLRRPTLDAELTEELRFHQEQLRRDGLASARIGNLTVVRQDARERWSIPWLEHFLQDVRYALRGLRRAPGFTAVVVLTLGLGIGANAAMFGAIDRLMFRPFPYLRDPATVHRIYLQWNERGKERTGDAFEYTRYLDLRKRTTSFSQYAGMTTRQLAVGVGDAARERPVGIVSAAFFDFFDMKPAAGRFFAAVEDTTPKGAPVAVLSWSYWQKEFGGKNVLGQTLQIRNVPSTIIGVTPKGFEGALDGPVPELYMPITTYAGYQTSVRQATTYFTTYNWGWMTAMLRRKPGVSHEAADRDLSNAYRLSWDAEYAMEPGGSAPSAIAKPRALVGPLKPAAGPDPGLESRTLRWVTGVAAIVLLIACANVANLFLARGIRRRRELAVRQALGVSRSRMLAQGLTESLVLAFFGCGAGLLLAELGGSVLGRFFLPDTGSFGVVTDWRTLTFAAGLAVLTGILTGLAPGILAGKGDLANSLKAGSREGTYHRSRTRGVLLVLQGALSVILLAGAGLFVRSLSRVRSMRLGFDSAPVLAVFENMRGTRLDDSGTVRLGRDLLAAAQAFPGVESAALGGSIPFYSSSGTALYVTGIDSVRKLGRFTYQNATADYFQTMGTRIVRGRAFDATDRANTPRVVVVSEAMAERLWPGKDALGQCIRVGADTMPCTTVIGIAENAVQRSLVDDAHLHYYLPLEQYEPNEGFVLFLKMKGDPQAAGEPVRKALQKVMPGSSYVTVSVFDDMISSQRRSWRMGATMFVAFGGLALLVAAVGLYGVISYNVAQRTHELGVRIALGARSPDLVRLITGQGIRYALAGVLVGSGVALALAGKLQPLLFQQQARDPSVFVTVGLLLIAVALLASALPALRATRADPNAALRAE